MYLATRSCSLEWVDPITLQPTSSSVGNAGSGRSAEAPQSHSNKIQDRARVNPEPHQDDRQSHQNKPCASESGRENITTSEMSLGAVS